MLNRYKGSDWDDAKALGKDDSEGGAFPDSSVGKESTFNVGDLGLIPGLEKGKVTHSSILAWRIPWTV